MPNRVSMAKEDKPLVSRRFAAVASIVLIIALVVTFYLLLNPNILYTLFSGLRLGVANPSTPQPPPEEEHWELSPLIEKYGIDEVTPVLVINCRYVFTGSDALGEKRGTYAEGTERENIGAVLCRATNESVFCSKFKAVPKYFSGEKNFPLCNKGNKTVIYAFHNPLCPICAAQRDVLDAFRKEFSSQVVLEYICVPTSAQGRDACSREFLIGKYNK